MVQAKERREIFKNAGEDVQSSGLHRLVPLIMLYFPSGALPMSQALEVETQKLGLHSGVRWPLCKQLSGV